MLIVEDEEMIRKGLRYTFDWFQLDCLVVGEAANGVEGLEKIKELDPDIIITDITMPVMDGITMLEKIHKDMVHSFIIISGYDEFEYAKKAIKLGVSEYLLKPVEQVHLSEALERAKEQCKLRNEYKVIKNSSIDIDDMEILDIELFQNFKGSHHVNNIIDYIRDNYNKRISINDLVVPLQKSSTYLNQKFKEETTFTFNEYVNRYRIKKSIDLMKTGEGKIYTIASDVGFSNYRYFISVFKKYTNCLPSDFLDYFKYQPL